MTYLDELKITFEKYLSSALDHVADSRIKEAMQYSLLLGGKRLRPLLLLAALEDGQHDIQKALPIAAAIEMIHTYSLIHDDLPAMDDDELRRGQPTCHIKFDEATAILAGDALLTEAFRVVMKASYDAQTRCFIASELASASGADGMILGQHYDLEAEHDKTLTEDMIVHIDRLKTGKLIALPLRIASYLTSGFVSSDMTLMGEKLGIAFQIQDDILDVTSSTEVLGKPVHSDTKQGKSTYLSLLGLDEAKAEVNRLFALILQLTQEKPQLYALIERLRQRDR